MPHSCFIHYTPVSSSFVSLSVPVSLQGSCCAALTHIALLHGRMGLEIWWALITGAKAGGFTLQLAEYISVLGSQECMA